MARRHTSARRFRPTPRLYLTILTPAGPVRPSPPTSTARWMSPRLHNPRLSPRRLPISLLLTSRLPIRLLLTPLLLTFLAPSHVTPSLLAPSLVTPSPRGPQLPMSSNSSAPAGNRSTATRAPEPDAATALADAGRVFRRRGHG